MRQRIERLLALTPEQWADLERWAAESVREQERHNEKSFMRDTDALRVAGEKHLESKRDLLRRVEGTSHTPIDRCPFCEDEGVESTGRYEGRILIGGRGMYICPKNNRHRWQNADEKPTTCGVAPIHG